MATVTAKITINKWQGCKVWALSLMPLGGGGGEGEEEDCKDVSMIKRWWRRGKRWNNKVP